MTISNTDDYIGSEDIKDRLEEMEEEGGNYKDDPEYKMLKALDEEAAAEIPDWEYGEMLVRYSAFVEHAQDLANDTYGSTLDDANWPLNYIDWPAAAEALKQDYNEVRFNGVSYYGRA